MRAAAALLLLALVSAPSARAGEDVDVAAVEEQVRRVTAGLAPSIVEVEALGGLDEKFETPENEEEAGAGILTRGGFKQAFGPSTGLVVSQDGLIITTTTVLNRDPRHIVVTLQDGRSFVARVLGRDDARALALLKIDCKDLPVARAATADELKQGRFAIALGRGLGTPTPSVSLGVVSALGRVGGRAIQSSAAISPANYGGPLASIDGAVFGVLVPLALDGGMASVDIYDSGIGFAIPMSDVLALVPRLARSEHLRPGFVGIAPDPASAGGARLTSVADGSPAKEAGLREGDLVVKVGQEPIDNAWQLRRALARYYADDEVAIEVRRGTETKTIKVKLAAAPEQAPAPPEQPQPPGPGHEEDR